MRSGWRLIYLNSGVLPPNSRLPQEFVPGRLHAGFARPRPEVAAVRSTGGEEPPRKAHCTGMPGPCGRVRRTDASKNRDPIRLVGGAIAGVRAGRGPPFQSATCSAVGSDYAG